MRPGELLVEEGRGATLADVRRQGLFAFREELPVHQPAADGAGQAASGALAHEQVQLVRVVLEVGADLAADDLVVLIPPRGEVGANALCEATELRRFRLRGEDVPARRQLDLSFLDEWNAVAGVVVTVAGAGVAFLPGERDAGVAEAAARLRVLDFPLGRVDVAVALAAAADVRGPSPVADGQRGGGVRLARDAAGVEHHGAVRPVHRTGGDGFVDDVDKPADGVRSVQERRRPAHDFDPRGARRIHRHAVVAGLAGEIAHALAVLEDQHAVAVHAANHRPRRAGAQGAFRNAGLGLQRCAQRGLELAVEIGACQHRRRWSDAKISRASGLTDTTSV